MTFVERRSRREREREREDVEGRVAKRKKGVDGAIRRW